MLSTFLRNSIFMAAGAALITSCATISESECVAGNWADLGYRDGVNGTDRSRIANYVEKCGEYGAPVDREQYLVNYETGLTHYCVYDKGFSLGENGSGYNSVCSGPQAGEFRAGYDDGRAQYELRSKFKTFEADIKSHEDEIVGVAARIVEPEQSADEVKRLTKKKKRLENELGDMKWAFRAFKRKYDLD